jgi:hypothetical protein
MAHRGSDMDLKSTKAELDAACEHIKRLEAELREAQFVLKILEVAGFIKGDKLDEARNIARTFFY